MPAASTTVTLQGKDKTQKAFSSVQKSVGRLKKSLGALKMGALGLGALGAGTFALAKKSQKAADEIGKMADRLKISTKAVQIFRFAGEQAGLTMGEMDKTLLELGRNIGYAATKTGAQRDAFNALGISAQKLKSMNMEETFLVLADALKDAPNRFEAMSHASDLFGRSGKKSINLFAGGAKAIHEYGDQLESVGGILSDQYIRNSEAANDASNRFSKVLTGTVSSALQGMAPATREAADGMAALFSPTGGGGGDGSLLVQFVRTAVKGLLQLRRVFGVLEVGVGGFFEFMLSYFKSGEAQVTRLAGLVKAVLGGAFDSVSATVGKTLNKIIEGINKLSDVVGVEPLQLIEIEKTPSVAERINHTLKETGQLIAEQKGHRAGIAEGMQKELGLLEAQHQKRVELFENAQKTVVVEQSKLDVTKRLAEEAAFAHEEAEQRKLKAAEEAAKAAAKAVAISEEKKREEVRLTSEALGEALEAERARRQSVFDSAREISVAARDEAQVRMMSETELMEQEYAKQVEVMQSAQEQGIITHDQAAFEIRRIEKNKTEALIELERQRMLATVDTMAGMAAAVSDQGQAFFEFSKALNVAQAIMNTYQAATKAFAQGGVFGIATGSLMIALGLAQVNKIKSTTFTPSKREVGGPVTKGRPYLVGERGPEMFVPKSAGDVQANSGATNVNIQINAVDTEGFDELLFARRAVIVSVINQAMHRQGKRGLV